MFPNPAKPLIFYQLRGIYVNHQYNVYKLCLHIKSTFIYKYSGSTLMVLCSNTTRKLNIPTTQLYYIVQYHIVPYNSTNGYVCVHSKHKYPFCTIIICSLNFQILLYKNKHDYNLSSGYPSILNPKYNQTLYTTPSKLPFLPHF